jgi:hypothetical protein
MTQAKSNCVHHWIIDGHDVGTCIKCGEVRDFVELQARLRPYRRTHMVARFDTVRVDYKKIG